MWHDEVGAVKTYHGYQQRIVIDLIDRLCSKNYTRFQIRSPFILSIHSCTCLPLLPDLIYDKHRLLPGPAVALGYQHAKSMSSVNNFFFKYIFVQHVAYTFW